MTVAVLLYLSICDICLLLCVVKLCDDAFQYSNSVLYATSVVIVLIMLKHHLYLLIVSVS